MMNQAQRQPNYSSQAAHPQVATHHNRAQQRQTLGSNTSSNKNSYHQQTKQKQSGAGNLMGRKSSLPSNYSQQTGPSGQYQQHHQISGGGATQGNAHYQKVGTTTSKNYKQSQVFVKQGGQNQNEKTLIIGGKGSGGKIVKSHAKYFSQQNSPVNRSGTHLANYPSKGRDQQHFHLHPTTTQNQNSAGYLGSGNPADRQGRLEYTNASNPSIYSNQHMSGQQPNSDSQQQLQAGFQSVPQQHMMGKQVNPTGPEMVRRSISSSEQRRTVGQGQVTGQNPQNYASLQKYQGGSQQVKNGQQLPSKFTNTTSTNYPNHSQYDQNYVKNSNIGGRISVGASRSSSNHHSVQNVVGGVAHPNLHNDSQVQIHSNSHQHQYPMHDGFSHQQQFGIPSQPSQQYIKQYHSTNQTPIISNTAGNQTVVTNNSLHSIVSNQQQQPMANYPPAHSAQTTKQGAAKIHAKQKYDESFLNGPINVSDQQTLNYNQDDTLLEGNAQHSMANFNAKRYMHNQSMMNFDPNQQTITSQHKKSMSQVQQPAQQRANTTLANYNQKGSGEQMPNSVYQLSKAEMRLSNLVNQPQTKSSMKQTKSKNQQKYSHHNQSIDKIAHDIFQRSVVNPNLNSTNPNDLAINQEGGVISAAHSQIKQPANGTMSIKNIKRGQKALTRPQSNTKNKQYALQNLIQGGSNAQNEVQMMGGQTISQLPGTQFSSNMQVSKFDIKGATPSQNYQSKSQHNSLTRHQSNTNYQQPQKKLKSSMGFDQPSNNSTIDMNNRQGSPSKVKRQSPQTLIVPQQQMPKPQQLMNQSGNYMQQSQGQYNQILHQSAKNQTQYSNVIGTQQQRLGGSSANILSKYNNNLHTLYNEPGKKPSLGQPHSTSHMVGPNQNSAATIVGASKGQTTLTTLTNSQKLISHTPGIGPILNKQQQQHFESLQQQNQFQYRQKNLSTSNQNPQSLLLGEKQDSNPIAYYEIDNMGASGRQGHKKQNQSQASIPHQSNETLQYVLKQTTIQDRRQGDDQASRLQQKNQMHHQRQMSQNIPASQMKKQGSGINQTSSRRPSTKQGAKSVMQQHEPDMEAAMITADAAMLRQQKNNISLNYGGPPMMTGAGNIWIQQTITKNANSSKVMNSTGSNSALAFNNKSITIQHNQEDPSHFHYKDSNSSYPYKASTTKSGKVPGQSSSSSSQPRKQQMAPGQSSSGLSIQNGINNMKGMNYKSSKMAQPGNPNSTQKVMKYKVGPGGVIVHPKGQHKPGALTTSANTAVNTAQNSPRTNNKSSLYTKNPQSNLNSSQRRKPGTAASVAAMPQPASSTSVAQQSLNSNRPGTHKQTTMAKSSTSKSPNMTNAHQSKANRQSTDRLAKYKSKSNIGSSKATPKQNRGDPDDEDFQQLRNTIHADEIGDGKHKSNFLVQQNFKKTDSQGQIRHFAGGSQPGSQHGTGTHPLHHQFMDGGTGSNPNLLQNVNVNNPVVRPHQPQENAHNASHSQLSSKYVKSSHDMVADQHMVHQQKANAQHAINQQVAGLQTDQLLNDHISHQEFAALKNELQHMPEGPLITEEEENEIRQVASDINEKAFFGKMLKTKQIVEASKFDENQLKRLSPRSQEIAFVMKKVDQSFMKTQNAPETELTFYRIGKMLGRGAFGKVNLAMHKLVRKLVALKSLNKECLTDQVQKQKLMKEVNLLLKLRHDHVVKIYETIETKKHIIIVMELCAGGDLLNYVRKRRRLKEPYAKKIFKQIVDGLGYIHSKFIAHRDIKLDNILLDGKGSVKIGDFGVSKQTQPGVKMREQCGTPAYIAPEILKNKNGYSFNVDLWSAGVVLFAMLYGTVPFKAASIEELHGLILRGIYTLKDDISQEARDMLRGLLEINPHKRLTVEQIYNHPWLKDYDESLQLFNDQEREMIKKEYTYNDPQRYNRNETEEPIDCFTEHNIDSVYNTLKNVSDKSIILAPFNSTQSEDIEVFKKQIQPMIVEKQLVIRLSRLCREIDRQYEFNNNGQLDNGVYHKQLVNSENNKSDEKKDKKKGDKEEESDDEDDELKFQVMQCSKSQGMEFLTEDYQDEKKTKEQFIKNMLSNLPDAERQLIESTFGTNKEMDLDESKIDKLVQYGYPKDYILTSLQNNEANYLTAGYYLLKMDQNYC